MNRPSRANAAGNEKTFRAIGYVLVFLMMACIVMEIGSLIHNNIPDWPSGVMAGVVLLVVIERMYTYPRFKELTPLSQDWMLTYAAHGIVIMVFSRLLLAYAGGPDAFRSEILLFARGYLIKFFSAELVVTLFLAAVVWLVMGMFLDLLDEIGLDQEVALRDEQAFYQANEVPAHQRLVNLVFIVGIVLVVLTAMTVINMRSVFASPDGIPRMEIGRFSGGEAGALLYFAFGLALLSLSRLMSLHTHWNRLRIPVSSGDLTRKWGIYSLLFLLGLLVLVSLLPAGDSLGFLSVLGTLVGFLIGVLAFLANLLMTIILLLLGLPFMLFGKAPPILRGSPPIPFPTLPPAGPTGPAGNNALWMLIRSIVLWGSLAAILLFAIIRFVRQHDEILIALRRTRAASWLALVWRWLRGNLEKTQEGLSRAIASGWQSLVTRLEGRRPLPRGGFLNLRSLDPRRRIYFFYLAMVRRGAEQGLPRKPSETPAEYAVTLEKAVDAAQEDIDALTGAFIEARYSRKEVDPAKANSVRERWARVRRSLQAKSKKDTSRKA